MDEDPNNSRKPLFLVQEALKRLRVVALDSSGVPLDRVSVGDARALGELR